MALLVSESLCRGDIYLMISMLKSVRSSKAQGARRYAITQIRRDRNIESGEEQRVQLGRRFRIAAFHAARQ
jgi:hypothetical protein